MVGIVAAVAYQPSDLSNRRLLFSPWWCVVFLALHIAWEFGAPGNTRSFYGETRRFGCFPSEAPGNGVTYRWCGERALIERNISPGTHTLELMFEAGPIPQTLSVSTDGEPPVLVTLTSGERRSVSIPIPQGFRQEGKVLVRVDATTSFVPKLLWSATEDTRRIAFKVYE